MSKELSVEEKKNKLINNVRENYRQVEESIVNQLFMKHDLHGTTIGSEREMIWGQLFEMIIPRKFVIESSVFIIDSEGKVSHEVDLAIMDETYTPYIFRYGKVKFVPIEAVAAVVECKSQSTKGVKNWAKSLNKLRTSDDSFARMATQIAYTAVVTQKSTRPIRILCTLSNCSEEVAKQFDFTLLAIKSDKNIEINLNPQKSGASLLEWYGELNFHKPKIQQDDLRKITNAHKLEKVYLNEYSVQNEEGINVSLLTFNFQLNQLLMLINNPILFPHRAYAKLFNHLGKEGQQ